MKIAILTLPLHTNYGGILQCYALQTVLQRMGNDVKVLSKPRYGLRHYLTLPVLVSKNLYKRLFDKVYVRLFETQYFYSSENIDAFIKKYIHSYIRRKYKNSIGSKFDAIVVGSDQIWRPVYSRSIDESFLSFLNGSKIKRIAYAASFGVDYCEYTEEQLKVCSSLIKNFDAISVREFSGINICRNNFGVDAVQMLDPTLLLNADDYRVLVNSSVTEPPKGDMLVYILDKTEEKISLVNRIASEKGLTPFWLDSPDEHDENLFTDKSVKMSVEQWLRSFDDAEFVFTDSFHGCVFSIIFNKQFLAIGNKNRGLTRFDSLLSMFSLRHRLIYSCNLFDDKINDVINYDDVNRILNVKRKEAFSFIESSLSC